MRRIPPYIDCILQYYLMETFGQVACTAMKRGTIGGHRRHATFFTPSSEGASRSEGVGLHQPPPGFTVSRRSGCVVQPDAGSLFTPMDSLATIRVVRFN